MNLGARLKKLRKAGKLSMDELARKAKVAKATLSRIENGQTPGTFKTHLKICQAFGISIKELYLGTKVLEGEVSSFEGAQPEDAELFTYDELTSSVILTSGVAKKNMLPQLLVLQPQGQTHLEESPRGTEKFIFGLEGTMEVKVAEVSYSLTKGGALYFKSSAPHFIKNAGAQEAKCLCVTSPVAL
ncbi:helix-turn-helix domain-containing protein [Candidatus Omnitrophota bacterium]